MAMVRELKGVNPDVDSLIGDNPVYDIDLVLRGASQPRQWPKLRIAIIRSLDEFDSGKKPGNYFRCGPHHIDGLNASSSSTKYKRRSLTYEHSAPVAVLYPVPIRTDKEIEMINEENQRRERVRLMTEEEQDKEGHRIVEENVRKLIFKMTSSTT